MAPASLSFVGNIDDSIEQLVASEQYDLCRPLPKEFDLAVIHRFHAYMPGWEIPPNSSKLLTDHYGLITDYLAEAFHHLFSKVNLFSSIKSKLSLNKMHEGRDETAVIKTVSAFCKMLHPGSEPSPEEMDEYIQYAIEGRRRVKEQLNKRKKDDEFANITLGFTNSQNQEIIVDCPESKGVEATQFPRTRTAEAAALAEPYAIATAQPQVASSGDAPVPLPEPVAATLPETTELKEKEIRIFHGDRGYSYRTLFLDYLQGAKKVRLEDPYIRRHHQITNFLHFCEVCVDAGTVQEIQLVTSYEDDEEKKEAGPKIITIARSLEEHGIKLDVKISDTLHDRRIELDNGWVITLGRGLDFYQRPDDWLEIGANELNLRQCTETTINYRKA
jgi:ATP-dependent Lon protease